MCLSCRILCCLVTLPAASRSVPGPALGACCLPAWCSSSDWFQLFLAENQDEASREEAAGAEMSRLSTAASDSRFSLDPAAAPTRSKYRVQNAQRETPCGGKLQRILKVNNGSNQRLWEPKASWRTTTRAGDGARCREGTQPCCNNQMILNLFGPLNVTGGRSPGLPSPPFHPSTPPSHPIARHPHAVPRPAVMLCRRRQTAHMQNAARRTRAASPRPENSSRCGSVAGRRHTKLAWIGSQWLHPIFFSTLLRVSPPRRERNDRHQQ